MCSLEGSSLGLCYCCLLNLPQSSKLLQLTETKLGFHLVNCFIFNLRCHFCLLVVVKLVVGHGHDGEDQVDQVEGAEENVEDEEGYVQGSGSLQRDLVEILPEVLGHQPEGAEKRVREIVKACVSIVRVRAIS